MDDEVSSKKRSVPNEMRKQFNYYQNISLKGVYPAPRMSLYRLYGEK